ncbi:MAG: hypothetical protein DMD80_14885 [Candidatus Rokuibacteriota bacterium]|nr:MAG: hypothetical protein DMD80_14885 [Candidatus Rokubacteria bacterium]PYN18797.1 MAG: hypothetical protein DMD76_28550 [Candidatus Rokubacteria bacterium]
MRQAWRPRRPRSRAAASRCPSTRRGRRTPPRRRSSSSKRFVDVVRVGNPNVEMVVYPNAGHAFHADYRASYQPAAAAAAWEKCLQFFARHLRA